MKKIALVFASAGLMALAACGEKPAEEANNANAVVENVVDNAMDNAANATNAAEATNAVNATNAANAM
jgi:hypothetical protein